MENTQNKKSRLSRIVIILVVLVCVALILVDVTTNLLNELDPQNVQQPAIEEIGTPTPNVRPTFPPDYTPLPIIDA